MQPQRLTILPNEERTAQVFANTKLALSATTADKIQFLTLEDVCKVKSLAGHGSELTVWETAREHFPAASPGLLRIDIAQFIQRHVREALDQTEYESVLQDTWYPQLFQDAVLSLARLTLLYRLGPSALAPIGDSMDVTTIAKYLANYTSKMAAHSIVKAIRGEAPEAVCFGRLTPADLTSGKNISVADQKPFKTEIRRMLQLASIGYWSDKPTFDGTLQKVTKTKAKAEGRTRRKPTNPYRPLPDAYVAEMGYKSSWLIENLGPSLLRVLKGLENVWKTAATKRLTYSRVSERCKAYLQRQVWHDATGHVLASMPFEVDDFGDDGNEAAIELAWPPRTFAEVIKVARVLQGAHLFVASLSMAPRSGETITFARDCVRFCKDGRYRAHGRTFKLVRQFGGTERDWLLPPFAAQALAQQALLVAAYERLSPMTAIVNPEDMPGGNHLWGRISVTKNRQEPLSASGPNTLLRGLARSLGMDVEPGGDSFVVHRFRKTLARLAALALTQAPKLLQDVFGHKSIEMTLYYILADKQLAQEVEVVERELRVMTSEGAIWELLAIEESQSLMNRLGVGPGSQGPGGLATPRLQKVVSEFGKELAARGESWAPGSVRTLARILTMDGRAFSYVRPGVLCTKAPGQAGICNKKKGGARACQVSAQVRAPI